MSRWRALGPAAVLLVVACVTALPRAAAAAEVSLGWALTDVGLDDDGAGPVLGLGARSAVAPGLDFAYAAEYALKRGAQPTIFTTGTNPSLRDDAKVTLHVAQVVAMLELAALPPPVPRPYAGLSAAIKLKEQWSAFPGVPTTEWGYKDIDFFAHAGLARRLGPVRLDLRYSRGLTRQLLVDPKAGSPAKAVDPLPGVHEPVAGAHLWQLQLAVSASF